MKNETANWSPEYALSHLRRTFDEAARSHSDLMEPYVVMLADSNAADETEIMRRGLRETILRRYPIKEAQS